MNDTKLGLKQEGPDCFVRASHLSLWCAPCAQVLASAALRTTVKRISSPFLAYLSALACSFYITSAMLSSSL